MVAKVFEHPFDLGTSLLVFLSEATSHVKSSSDGKYGAKERGMKAEPEVET